MLVVYNNPNAYIVLSWQRMNKLQTDGTEMVTNILVASDAWESKRRAELEELRRLRYFMQSENILTTGTK